MMTKLSPEQFLSAAAPVTVLVGETSIVALPRQFSTGSLGFYANGKAAELGKVSVLGAEFNPKEQAFKSGSTGAHVNGKVETTIAGVPVTLQVSGNLTKIGSKPGSTTKSTGYQVGLFLTVVGSKPDAANAKAADAAAASFATSPPLTELEAPPLASVIAAKGTKLSTVVRKKATA